VPIKRFIPNRKLTIHQILTQNPGFREYLSKKSGTLHYSQPEGGGTPSTATVGIGGATGSHSAVIAAGPGKKG